MLLHMAASFIQYLFFHSVGALLLWQGATVVTVRRELFSLYMGEVFEKCLHKS